MGRFYIAILFVLGALMATAQNRTQITLRNADGSAVQNQVQKNAQLFVNAANVASARGKTIDWDNIDVTKNARERVNALWETSVFRCTETRLTTSILRLPGNRFQVRQIPVVVVNEDRVDQELVLNFSAVGALEDVYFGIERHRYTNLMSEGRDLRDFRRRQMILDFIENFRTAYNRKDLDMLEMTFSENALIIVGRVLQETERGFDGMASLGDRQVELIRFNKQQYMENLRRVFRRNAFINVTFDDIEIVQHGHHDEIYGVNLKQTWRSSTYGDEGYLFLMIDFEDEDHPLIHVRAWQPEKDTPMEEVIELGDFDIVK